MTTTLELESGILPVGIWYDEQTRKGRAINYGASASWTFARIAELSPQMGEPQPTMSYFQSAYRYSDWQFDTANRDQIDRIVARLDGGLAEGALGIGINNGYVPGPVFRDVSGRRPRCPVRGAHLHPHPVHVQHRPGQFTGGLPAADRLRGDVRRAYAHLPPQQHQPA